MNISLGQKVPKFSLPATSERTITQQDLLKHYTVLYFYPKDSTPGCTTEGKDFSELRESFQALNCQILGVSMDSMKRHESFKSKQGFTFDLISDTEAELCQIFGTYQLKKNFGKEYMGIVRSTFLIDPDGKLVAEWQKVKVKDHAQAVLEKLKELSK
ncbi:peroxiredoxin [Thiomicrorhabdus sp. ZW0627]|uniref:peroxiredoxin n=1 Tax=Thiomicrorhabdus sp. ZW0627 TaxID=3039774 RepID=UPI00243718B3|nr:peroxiredoxin [Thiomicrorhabdus sp. ZW0627]MDG6773223.1 peroxiredoxin [Thiomicrorhabdus sp. ZW0627]